jgi:hypothetical protein
VLRCNTNVSNLSVTNLSCDLTPNISAGAGISVTSVGGIATITNTGLVSDPLNLSKLNVSNISCDEGITTNTLTCDLTPNLTAGAGVSITSVSNKPVISGVNSVTANVPVSDFIETLQIVPSGTTAFVNQAAGQTSQLISVYDFQGGTAYTAGNMFTVNAGDKIVFNWKQSGWVMTVPGQQSYVICYIVKGTNAVPQAGDTIEVGRIYQYVYSQSDHEEITGSFVYNVPSTFSFYRSQMITAPNLVTQGQDYGAATATVYRSTVPNSISVPTLINLSNLSVDNLSTNLLNNISAGQNITLSTEAVTNKLVITAVGGLNSSNLSLDNLSVDNVSVTTYMTAQQLSVLNNLNVSNNLYVYGDGGAVGRVRAGGIDFKESTTNTKTAYIDVLNSYTKVYLKKTMDFIKDDGAGGTEMIMSLDWGRGNVNMDNLSSDNISTHNLSVDTAITAPSATITDLTITSGGTFNHNLIGSITEGANMSIVSVANKPRIGLNPDINISNMSVDNISCSGDLNVSLINASTIHAEALNVSGSAPLFTDGLTIYGSTTTQNISTSNISSTGFITAVGDIRAGGGFRATGGSGIFSTGAIQFNNQANGLGDTLEIYYTGTQFGMGTTSGKDFTINNGINTGGLVIDGTLNNVNMSNCSIDNLSSTNTSILNDMTITRDLDVDRYLSYKPRFLTRWRDNIYGITGTAQDVQWNRVETAMAGGALQVSGDGIQALLAGWYRVDWSVGYRKLNDTAGERLTARTYLRINNVFYGKYGYGTTIYLRSSTQNRSGFSSGSQLVYANTNDIIHVRTDCMVQANTDFTSNFNGQRILADSRFSCEYVSNSGET